MLLLQGLCILLVLLLGGSVSQELLTNEGFESFEHWDCWEQTCSLSDEKHSGQHAVHTTDRQHDYDGPSQYVSINPGETYAVTGWAKLGDDGGTGQDLILEFDFTVQGGSHEWVKVAKLPGVRSSDGWIQLKGLMTAPNKPLESARFYYQGPAPGIDFYTDDASVRPTTDTQSPYPGDAIDNLRRSDINIRVVTPDGINKDDVKIHVLQTKKSFPFGSAVNAGRYNDPSLQGYRDFVHQHFNWAVPENSLKWGYIEPQRGQKNYDDALTMIHGLKAHGLKVRGHNLVWSVDQFVQDWVKQLSGDDLRKVVKDHIEETMDKTRGLLEHWDVNNENLHGSWYQTRLNDNDYAIELFRIAHNADPSVKLFLNDYNVVAWGGDTDAYLHMAWWIQAANVGLYGMGAQCHFGDEEWPDGGAIKSRLDHLAQAGIPIWITELDVQAWDENKRADFYESALRTFYEHPAVEGILFWGFWDKQHWRGEKAALIRGDNFELTAAGRRVLDLFENQWMTDETRSLTSLGDQFTVRGFHGDYEVKVIYQGRELEQSKETFELGKASKWITINVQTS